MADADARRGGTPYDRQIDLIAEMSQEFAGSRDLRETFQRGLARVVSLIGAEAAALFLIDEVDGALVCRACVGPVDITGLRLAPGEGVIGRVVEQNVATIVKDACSDRHFGRLIDEKTGFTPRSLLCAPLSVRGESLGAIQVINKQSGGLFHQSDRQLLRALGASAALAILNARLTKAMVEREWLERELTLAAEIQRSMLPVDLPADFPVQGINRPAHQVSGDFFDIVRLPGGQVAFAVGDVSGKGMNAALLMSKVSGLFRLLAKTGASPGRLLAAINGELCEMTSAGGMFVTMVAGLFDPATGSARLANAGHEPPLLQRGFEFTAFPAGSPPLGIAADLVLPTMPETQCALEGGSLVVFSDGLTEAGAERGTDAAQVIRRMLNQTRGRPIPDRLRSLVDPLMPVDGILRDDITLLLVEDPRSVPILSLKFDVCPEFLCDLRRHVGQAAAVAGCSAGVSADVILAVDEACQNIFRHAYGGKGEVSLEIRRRPDRRLEVQLIDFAAPVDPAKIKPRALEDLRPGGLGTHFMYAVMDEIRFMPAPSGTGNILQMIKAIE